MHERDDLLDRIKALEQQLATVIERTGGTAQASRPSTSAARVGKAAERRQPPRQRGRTKPVSRKLSPAAATRGADESHAAHAGPARIPGVRIACIGVRPDTVDAIRAYWETRGASFQALSAVETSLHALDRCLGRADVVLFCVDGVDTDAAARLQTYCDQTEKPLIPIQDGDASELARAIEGGYPLG
jgi:hypothetical protein